MNALTALCGHPTCNPFQLRSSVLDAAGDVVLYHACDGTRHVFRDGHDDGLVLTSTAGGWTLTRERHVERDARWVLVPDAEPVCIGRRDGSDWIAIHAGSGRTIVRADTLYGAIARAGRFYLRIAE